MGDDPAGVLSRVAVTQACADGARPAHVRACQPPGPFPVQEISAAQPRITKRAASRLAGRRSEMASAATPGRCVDAWSPVPFSFLAALSDVLVSVHSHVNERSFTPPGDWDLASGETHAGGAAEVFTGTGSGSASWLDPAWSQQTRTAPAAPSGGRWLAMREAGPSISAKPGRSRQPCVRRRQHRHERWPSQASS